MLVRSRPSSGVTSCLVGRMSAFGPIRGRTAQAVAGESARVQVRTGAPGWNRTSDTRFRKHEEGVVARIASCAKLLHGPRFCAGSVLGRAQVCSTVVRRLVGRTSAILKLACQTSAFPSDFATPPVRAPLPARDVAARGPCRGHLARRCRLSQARKVGLRAPIPRRHRAARGGNAARGYAPRRRP